MKSLLLLILVFFFTLTTMGQSQATATFTASVTVVEPIGIKNTADLDFASIDAEKGGTVILTPAGERIAQGGAELADSQRVSAATFSVTGEAGLSYSISIPQGKFFLTNGVNQVVLSDFTSNLGNTGRLSENFSELRIGATIEFSPGQTPGSYSSATPLSVTVNYN